MRLTSVLIVAASLCSQATSQWTAEKFYDASSGITYSSITLNGVAFRIALPPLNSPTSDAIIQISAPNKFGWCGLSWGGRMIKRPLSIAWPTRQAGQAATIGGYWATAYSMPSPYSSASHTPLKISPSKTDGQSWTATARCQGCTQWDTTNLNTNDGETRFAFACSTSQVLNPTSGSPTFQVHEVPGSWMHDLRIARNSSFSQWVG